MANQKKQKFVGVANPEMHRAMFAKRISNAATPHLDGRTKRARTRGAALKRVLRDEN